MRLPFYVCFNFLLDFKFCIGQELSKFVSFKKILSYMYSFFFFFASLLVRNEQSSCHSTCKHEVAVLYVLFHVSLLYYKNFVQSYASSMFLRCARILFCVCSFMCLQMYFLTTAHLSQQRFIPFFILFL